MENFDINNNSHTRFNILTGDWILVSPQRNKRPWQGKVENLPPDNRPSYDPKCYLCPRNTRADGSVNPDYKNPFAFTNDFSALLMETPDGSYDAKGLLSAKSEKGICRVISFSPDHSLTLPLLTREEIEKVIEVWTDEFKTIGSRPEIKYIQIFENKGEIMG